MFEAIYDTLTYLRKGQMLDTMKNLLNTFLPRVDREQSIMQLGKAVITDDISGQLHWNEPLQIAMGNFFLKGFLDLFGTTPRYEESSDDECESTDGEESEEETKEEIVEETKEKEGNDGKVDEKDEETFSKKRFSDVSVGDLQDFSQKEGIDEKIGDGDAAERFSSTKRVCH